MLPLDLLPSALGLAWNMPRQRCQVVLKSTPFAESDLLAAFNLTVGTQPLSVRLIFDEGDRLVRIEHDLYESEEFWEVGMEVVEAAGAACRSRYDEIVRGYSAILGPALFAGDSGMPGYPEDETIWLIAVWDLESSHIRVEADHGDRELPFTITVSSQARSTARNG